MLRILPLLILCTILSGQAPTAPYSPGWIKWDGEWTTVAQRGFAYDCFNVGRQRGRGHTLAGIAWMESSLGERQNHGGVSFGPFGLGLAKMRENRTGLSDPMLIWLAETDLEWAGNVALDVFEHEMDLLVQRGFDERTAWMYAYSRYNKGNRWRRFKGRAETFNRRVRFFQRELQWE